MAIQLFRIDDRLIHGQVVIGWAGHLHSKEIILCDDSVADNDWEKELYLSIVPDRLNVQICTTEMLATMLSENRDLSKTIILVSSPFEVEDILKRSISLPEINIGGIHFKDGRHKYLPYLYLNPDEVSCLSRCLAAGMVFNCQDMPESKKIPLPQILPAN